MTNASSKPKSGPNHFDYCEVICPRCCNRIPKAKWDGKMMRYSFAPGTAVSLQGNSKQALFWNEKFPSRKAWPSSNLCSKCSEFIKRNMKNNPQKIYPAVSRMTRHEECPRDKGQSCTVCQIGELKVNVTFLKSRFQKISKI